MTAIGVGAVVLAACSQPSTPTPPDNPASQGTQGGPGATGSATPTGSSSGGAPAQPPTTGDPALATYYAQRLDWRACAAYECADLRVPVDYAKPDGGDLAIKVLRVRARDQDNRIGSLVVNPGGPGGSGVDYASAADRIVGSPVRDRFDVVGFDPRGVASSSPIDCLDDRALDVFMGTDQTPDTDAEQQTLLEQAKAMGSGCADKSSQLLPHVSTVDAAKDMDVLRAALGDQQLNYLGKSYGTFLGATYAGLFPQQVGRFVLDGVVPPDLSSKDLAEGQARGFELATRAYVQDCVDRGACILGESVDAGMQWIRDFLERLDAQPLPSGDSAVPQLNEAWATWGMAQSLYARESWESLTRALEQAQGGDGSTLMALANQYASRNPGGGYTGNIMEVIFAVNCLDRPDSPDLAAYEGYATEFTTKAPTWGRALAWGSVPCGVWPVKGGTPAKITAEGSNTIVVVGTTRDPATIYEWSQRLRDQLSNSVLVSFDGDGHTAYRQSNNSCVDGSIDTFYVEGTPPKDGLRC